jgi:hypothetical protein
MTGVRDPGPELGSATSVAGGPDRSVGEQSPDVRYNAFAARAMASRPSWSLPLAVSRNR